LRDRSVVRVTGDTRSGSQPMLVVDGMITGALDEAMNKKILAVVLVAVALLVSGGVVYRCRAA
jgi:hypothetical protein